VVHENRKKLKMGEGAKRNGGKETLGDGMLNDNYEDGKAARSRNAHLGGDTEHGRPGNKES